MPSEMKRLTQLEEENAKLERIVADLSLDKEMLRGVIKPKLCGLRGGARWSTRSGGVAGEHPPPDPPGQPAAG